MPSSTIQRKVEKNTCSILLQLKVKKAAVILNTSFGTMKITRYYWTSTEKYNQRLNHIHWNPVPAGIVAESWHWIYSSATDYFSEKKGPLDLIILDGF